MISVEQALSLITERALQKTPISKSLPEAVGFVLAKEVVSDIDSPPYDKSMVDGFAVITADVKAGATRLSVLEEVTAGMVPSKTVKPGTATQIMTGAPIPQGADAVVMVEQTELVNKNQPDESTCVHIQEAPRSLGQNIMRQGTSLRAGQTVLSTESEVRPLEVGVLSEVGRTSVQVYPLPSVAVLATGNELVPVKEMPGPGKIRNSNSPMLCAMSDHLGAKSMNLGVAKDTREHLRKRILEGLQADILILSGGVSAGALDLVPAVLEELKVEQVFHKVRLKPGKPLWFGLLDQQDRRTLVFGLPGNPVSCFVCYELFIRPAINRIAGRRPLGLVSRSAALQSEQTHYGDREMYLPAMVREEEQGAVVQTIDWKGSADLGSLVRANCLAYFPAGNRTFQAGEMIKTFLF